MAKKNLKKKDKISKSEYLQLIGLENLAKYHRDFIKNIEIAVLALLNNKLTDSVSTKEDWIMDFVWTDSTPTDILLERLNLEKE